MLKVAKGVAMDDGADTTQGRDWGSTSLTAQGLQAHTKRRVRYPVVSAIGSLVAGTAACLSCLVVLLAWRMGSWDPDSGFAEWILTAVTLFPFVAIVMGAVGRRHARRLPEAARVSRRGKTVTTIANIGLFLGIASFVLFCCMWGLSESAARGL
jgi:hypothetical protein